MTDGFRNDGRPLSLPEDPGRRRLLVLGVGAACTAVAAVTLGPAAAFLTHPLRVPTTTGSDAFIPAGSLANIAADAPTKVDLFADKVDAWNRVEHVKVGSAWVMKRGDEIVALSTVCPHLGCAIDYDAEGERFVCPCHDSYFDADGNATEGPSPRGMDRLEVQTEGDALAIRYQRFRQGTEDKEPV
jgi:menaquinol-cytochrome c reductase iron-sulfur subunit